MKEIDPSKLIIIDIETASEQPSFDSLEDDRKLLWEEKVQRILPEGMSAAHFYPVRASVMAEFARIVCISLGYFNKETHILMHIRSFYDSDEKKLLQDFTSILQKIDHHQEHWCFAGHNIREFDIPFICRRMIIHQLPIPSFLDFQNMKPWETNIMDTFQLWRFGDYKQFTSLKLLANILQVPSSKDDIDGSMVGPLYWSGETQSDKDDNLKRIVRYCQKDVVTTGNIILRFCRLPLLNPKDVTVIE